MGSNGYEWQDQDGAGQVQRAVVQQLQGHRLFVCWPGCKVHQAMALWISSAKWLQVSQIQKGHNHTQVSLRWFS